MSDLIQTGETAVSTEVVNFLDDVIIPSSELKIPRLNIVQSMSKVLKEGGKLGQWYNSASKAEYGDWMDLIVLSVNFGAVYLVQGEGLKCRSSDRMMNMHGEPCSKCPHQAHYDIWGKDGSPPLCDKTIDLLVYNTHDNFPAVVSFKSGSYTAGQDLLTNLKMVRETKLVKLGVKEVSGKKGDYYIPTIRALQTPTPEHMQAATSWKNQLKSKSFVVDDDSGSAAVDENGSPF